MDYDDAPQTLTAFEEPRKMVEGRMGMIAWSWLKRSRSAMRAELVSKLYPQLENYKIAEQTITFYAPKEHLPFVC